MTQVPEAQLARELNIPFCAVGMVTDWDAWRGEDSPVTQADVNKVWCLENSCNVVLIFEILRLIF